jgi:hypothetical protein
VIDAVPHYIMVITFASFLEDPHFESRACHCLF